MVTNPLLHQRKVKRAFQFPLVHTGFCVSHHFLNGNAGVLLGLRHKLNFFFALHATHGCHIPIDVLDSNCGILLLQGCCQSMGRGIGLVLMIAPQIQEEGQLAKAPGILHHGIETIGEILHIGNIGNTGNLRCLCLPHTAADPLCQNFIEGLNEQGFAVITQVILTHYQDHIFPLDTGKIKEIPVYCKGIGFILGLHGGTSGEDHYRSIFLFILQKLLSSGNIQIFHVTSS